MMRTFSVVLFFNLLLFSGSSYAFDWNACKNYLSKGQGVGLGILFATSSYFSSTGNCSMLGQVEHVKRVFMAQNFLHMKADFAKGRGEYADSYAKLHGCNLEKQILFSSIIKTRYSDLLDIEAIDDFESIYQFLESHFDNDEDLKNGCIIINRTS